MKPKWEYLMRWCPQWRNLPEELNFQGQLGWQLCCSIPTQTELGSSWLVFKRELP